MPLSLNDLPLEMLAHILVADHIMPRGCHFCLRGVCRLWRAIVEPSAIKDAERAKEWIAIVPPTRLSDDPFTLDSPTESKVKGGLLVCASAVIRWVDAAPKRWDDDPASLVRYCVDVGGAWPKEALFTMVAAGRPALTRYVLDVGLDSVVYSVPDGTQQTATRPRKRRLLCALSDRAERIDMTRLIVAAAVYSGSVSNFEVVKGALSSLHCWHPSLSWALRSDSADMAEHLLRLGVVFVGSRQEKSGWACIGSLDAVNVLARLRAIIANVAGGDDPLLPILTASPTYVVECAQSAAAAGSLRVLDALRSSLSIEDVQQIGSHACAYGRLAVAKWAAAVVSALGARPDIESWASATVRPTCRGIEVRIKVSARYTGCILRWLCSLISIPLSTLWLSDLVRHASNEWGRTGCALFILETWPREVMSLGYGALSAVVQRTCAVNLWQYTSEVPNVSHVERLVCALDECRRVGSADAVTVLDGIDLWSTLLIAVRKYPDGCCVRDAGAVLKHAWTRCTDGCDLSDPHDDVSADRRAPKEAWLRFCRVRPVSMCDVWADRSSRGFFDNHNGPVPDERDALCAWFTANGLLLLESQQTTDA